MPFVRAYLRVSHRDSASSGVSPETQAADFVRWFNYEKACGKLDGYELAPDGWEGGPDLDEFGVVRRDRLGIRQTIDRPRTDGVYLDLAKSAWRKMFLERPAAIRINAQLKSGDIIWFYRLDRSFRNCGDACRMNENWKARGIRMVIHGSGIDTRTAAGTAFFQMSAVWAEFFSSQLSERNLDNAAFLRSKNRPVNQWKPLGYRCLSKSANTWTPDPVERAIMAAIVKARHSTHPRTLSWRKVSDAIELELSIREQREYLRWPSFHPKKVRFWSPERCERAYSVALEKGWAELPPGVPPRAGRRPYNRRDSQAG